MIKVKCRACGKEGLWHATMGYPFVCECGCREFDFIEPACPVGREDCL